MPTHTPQRLGTAVNARLTAAITPAPPPVSRSYPDSASHRPRGSDIAGYSTDPDPITATSGRAIAAPASLEKPRTKPAVLLRPLTSVADLLRVFRNFVPPDRVIGGDPFEEW